MMEIHDEMTDEELLQVAIQYAKLLRNREVRPVDCKAIADQFSSWSVDRPIAWSRFHEIVEKENVVGGVLAPNKTSWDIVES